VGGGCGEGGGGAGFAALTCSPRLARRCARWIPFACSEEITVGMRTDSGWCLLGGRGVLAEDLSVSAALLGG